MGIWERVAMVPLKFHMGPSWNHFRGGLPTERAACVHLLPLWTPHAIRLRSLGRAMPYHSMPCSLPTLRFTAVSEVATCRASSLRLSNHPLEDPMPYGPEGRGFKLAKTRRLAMRSNLSNWCRNKMAELREKKIKTNWGGSATRARDKIRRGKQPLHCGPGRVNCGNG
jgi:hypothetical protein